MLSNTHSRTTKDHHYTRSVSDLSARLPLLLTDSNFQVQGLPQQLHNSEPFPEKEPPLKYQPQPRVLEHVTRIPKMACRRPAVHHIRLTIVVLAVSIGSMFQVMPVTNNTEHIVKAWINGTTDQRLTHTLTRLDVNVLWSAFVCALPLGACVGACLLYTVSGRLGRRYGLMLAGAIEASGVVFICIAKRYGLYELLVVGRVLTGVSFGLTAGLAPMFLTEIAPIGIRGACGASLGPMIGLADLLGVTVSLPQLLGTPDLWDLSYACPAIASAFMVIVLMFAHETPHYLLLEKKNRAQAVIAAEFYQGVQCGNSSVQELVDHNNNQTAGTHWNIVWFVKDHQLRVPILLCIAAYTAKNSTGIGLVMSYSTSILENAGIVSSEAQLFTVGIGGFMFLIPLLTVFTVDRLGRRKVLFPSLCGCILAVTVVAVLCGQGSKAGSHTTTAYGAAVSMMIYLIFFGLAEPVVMFMASEMFDQSSRGMAMTILTVISNAEQTIQLFVYPPLSASIGVTYSFLPFILLTAVCTLCLYFWLPETKGKTISEITAYWKTPEIPSSALETGRPETNGLDTPKKQTRY